MSRNLASKYKAFFEGNLLRDRISKTFAATATARVLQRYCDQRILWSIAYDRPEELLLLALDAGLGSKNSQGFDAWRLLASRA